MSKLELVDTFKIPSWAMPALVNGDYSGVPDEDANKIDRWLDSLYHDSLCFEQLDSTEFDTQAAFGLPCSTIRCHVYGHRKQTLKPQYPEGGTLAALEDLRQDYLREYEKRKGPFWEGKASGLQLAIETLIERRGASNKRQYSESEMDTALAIMDHCTAQTLVVHKDHWGPFVWFVSGDRFNNRRGGAETRTMIAILAVKMEKAWRDLPEELVEALTEIEGWDYEVLPRVLDAIGDCAWEITPDGIYKILLTTAVDLMKKGLLS